LTADAAPRLDALPSLAELRSGSGVFAIPLTTRFRGIDVREGMLLEGPLGWAEFAPFADYGPHETARWLASAIETGWTGWPVPKRARIPVNAIVPAVSGDAARAIVRDAGCATVKVKVASPGQTLDDDVARVAAVRSELGAAGRIRVDANGSWSVAEATVALQELSSFDLEYVEQPCSSVADCAELRRQVAVPVAIDEGLRRAPLPSRVDGIREAADVIVLKVAPLAGIRNALDVADTYGLPCVVSSALDTSIGLSAGAALAGCLGELPFACGLGSGLLLRRDVVAEATRIIPRDGFVEVGRRIVDVESASAVAAPSGIVAGWQARLAAAWEVLASA
jgi:O-succinylbenzoate synthase